MARNGTRMCWKLCGWRPRDAHLKAYQTGTGVVYRRNGKMGVYPPDPDMYEDLIPPPFEDSYEI